MTRLRYFSAVPLSAALLSSLCAAQTAAPAPPVETKHAMVVSIHHEATDAGVEVLRAGGNSVDAAVAVGFALAVVYPAAGNIGGGGFMLVRPSGKRMAEGRAHFLDFRERAPAAASRDMYLDAKGNVVPKMSTLGAKASGVPGTVAGLAYAEEHFGKLGLKRVMQPAIRLAREGWVLSDAEVNQFHSKTLEQSEGSKRIFQRNGNFYAAGERLVQPELAVTLERIAVDPGRFYHGDIARQIDAYERANNGLITADDLAGYEVKDREPIVGRYHGLEVVTAPPPSSGGIALIETLNILSGYDLKTVGADRSPAQIHLITEAFRRAFMDRAEYLGDPDYNTLPVKELTAQPYADAWRAGIDATNPSPSLELKRPAGFVPPPPVEQPARHESPQTTHFSVVDRWGNAVSMTYTLNFGFGSGVTVDPLGFLLNDEMDDFTSKVGVPNNFGLLQGPANAIAPGHRPLSAMSPTVVSELPRLDRKGRVKRPGKLRLVLGSPGGPTIITTVANDLISVVDNGLTIQQAAEAPRFHHQWMPDTLQFEKAFPVPTVEAMKAAGYEVKRESEFDEKSPGTWGDSELIERDPKTGHLLGGHDSRRPFGKADGY